MPVLGGSENEFGAMPWQRRLDQLLAKHKTIEALRLLDEVINDEQLNLFVGEADRLADRRFAWLYRIDLLRSLGRLREALAWTCLECEFNPDNVTAQALKTRLK